MKSNYDLASRNYNLGTETAFTVLAKANKLASEGKNIINLIKGTNNESPHEAYYFYYGKHLQAIRMGKWKLHFPHGYRTMAGNPGGKPTNVKTFTKRKKKK